MRFTIPWIPSRPVLLLALLAAAGFLLPSIACAQAPGGLPWDTPTRRSPAGATGAAQRPVLMYYGVEVVSDYVFRGDDMYVREFTKDGKEHASVNLSPAVRPQITLFSPTITFNVLGTFAYNDRPDKPDNDKGAFYGLEREDEIDYTLAYRWRTELGRFTAGIIRYSFLDQGRVGPTRSTPHTTPQPNPTEMFLGWDMPFWPKANPNFYHYAGQNYGDAYSAFSFDGAASSRLAWFLNFGFVRVGPKDVTGQLRWELGAVDLSFNAAYRPDPKTLSYRGASGYDKEGKYIIDPSKSDKLGTYPSTLYWLGISVGGRVRGRG
jgi:hypothetical protein